MNAAIVDRGRGPQIAGTRITVFDIMDYLRLGWHHTAIAAWLRLSSAQVLAAMKYIEEHKEYCEEEYKFILEREARGNPPEIQAKLDAIHAKWAPIWEARRKAHQQERDGNARHPGGQQQ